MKISLRKLEHLWHTFAFVLLSGAFIPLWRKMSLGYIDPGEGDPVQRLFLGVAYLGVGLLILHPRRAWRVSRHGWLVWVLLGWAMLSTFWSAAPEITLLRSLTALLGALYGLLLAVRYRPEEVLRMLGAALAIVMAASLMAVMVIPEWAIMGRPHEGAWQGVLFHKNALGRTAAFALAVFWVLARAERSYRSLLWWGGMVAAAILVVGSRSVTGLLLALALPLSWWGVQTWRKLPRLLRPATGALISAVAIPGFFVLPDILEKVLGFFGRDLTLTGRIPLWLLLIPLALARPLLGYGYGAFWLGESGPSALIWAVTWDAPHAHNGYLDMWLEIGLMGVAIAIFMLVLTLARYVTAALQARENPIVQFSFWVSMLTILGNMSEAVLLESGLGKALYWVLFAYICLVELKQDAFSVKQP
jgi:O-antigen ligase